MELTNTNSVDRRQFLATSTSGFLLSFVVTLGGPRWAEAGITPTPVNAYIKIGSDEIVTILFGGCEMGQGAMTGLAQIVAEELMADWNKVRVETAPPSAISYTTGGSSAVRRRYDTLRKAGAAGREMLVAAAAKTWNVPVTECTASLGVVIHKSGKSLTYGALAPLAATFPVPANPVLTDPAKFRLIGKPIQRLDIPSKVNGSAGFGIDVRVPNMIFAVVKHCPTIGGTLAVVPSTPPGAIAVVPLMASDTRGAMIAGSYNAVAVVADNTWNARRLASQLSVKWTIPSTSASLDSAAFTSEANTLMASGTPIVAETSGDPAGAMIGASRKLEATYSFPYLAHATLEPLNCSASVTPTGCEVWAPNQAANSVLATAKAITGLDASQIRVTTTLLGGGLGRKIEQDYVSQAIQVSKALLRPVKLTWTREEDFGHDQYRPAAQVRLRAGLDTGGNIVSWVARNVSPAILGQRGSLKPGVADSQAVEGLVRLPYAFSSRMVEWIRHSCGIPLGFWRSVGSSINAFAVECMLDEVAQALKVDPLMLRKQLTGGDPRLTALFNAIDQLSSWRLSLPSGHAWGIAYAESFQTLVCQVVDVSKNATTGQIQVHRVAIAVDCGLAVNPNSIEAQMQGGMVHGLAAALWGNIPFKAGVAQVRNFNNYRMLRMREMPKVDVTILNSGYPVGGIGEPAVPPIGPAVANAWARLTGQRLRSLPLFPNFSTMSD